MFITLVNNNAYQALDVVVQDWEVNIISLSFGWQETAAQAYTKDHGEAYTEYKNAIQRASGKALVFAAATNDGPNVGRAWPARESGVFCVHSTDGKGTWSWELNPQKWDPEQSLNLAVVGEAVESYWPCSDPKKLTRMDKMTRSGTSYAAPIAASIAAFLLMFGQKYLDEEQAANLKKFHHMKAVLQAVCRESIAEGHVKPDGFNYLHLSLDSDNFFGKNLDKITEIISNALRGRG
jgi:subtilisin family serine protease